MGRKLLICFFTLGLLMAAVPASAKKFTLVIDAGHGGNDAGARGAISKEKDLTLRYALAFGQMVERNCPDVNVIYTRKTDRFLELWQRAEIANKNKADLFISVHINAVAGNRQVRGFQTYTLGRGRKTGSTRGFEENLEVAKRENAVILLEKNYKQTYQGYDPNSPESDIIFEFIQDKNMENSIELARLMQKYVCAATKRKDMGAQQDNLAVLRLSSMPGCLIELGFISTRDEEQFMNSPEATSMYARGIYNAFVAYKKQYFGGPAVLMKEEVATPSENKSVPEVSNDTEPADTAKTKTAEKTEPQSEKDKAQPEKDKAQSGKDKAQPEKEVADQSAVFKVQLLSSSRKLKEGSLQLKGVKNTDCYEENGLYKYTVGASTDYNEIYRLRKQMLDKFPEAFIIAFRNGTKVNASEAYQEFKRSRNIKK